MIVLIFGHKGWIGDYVCKLLAKQSITVHTSGTVRASDQNAVELLLNEIQPTHVMCFIGRTHGKIGNKVYSTIDYLEQSGKITENINDNLYSPVLLAEMCRKRDIHLTYMGTGCIFQYDENHQFEKEINGFTETDAPNFFGSSYSVVKGFTDKLMHLYDNVLNIRIRMPISDDASSRNFINKIIKYDKICSIKNSMTVLPELLPIMIDLAKINHTGTVNLVNPGLISHNEILYMYKDIVNNNFTWNNFSKEEQAKILDADRSNNYLDTTVLQTMYPNVKDIKTSVRDILIKIKNNHQL